LISIDTDMQQYWYQPSTIMYDSKRYNTKYTIYSGFGVSITTYGGIVYINLIIFSARKAHSTCSSKTSFIFEFEYKKPTKNTQNYSKSTSDKHRQCNTFDLIKTTQYYVTPPISTLLDNFNLYWYSAFTRILYNDHTKLNQYSK
jgi:hypothetical protein